MLDVAISWRADAPTNLVKLAMGRCLIAEMDSSKWTELALLTDTEKEIYNRPRMLRSLRFGDDDYNDCVLDMVSTVLGERPDPTPAPWTDPFRSAGGDHA